MKNLFTIIAVFCCSAIYFAQAPEKMTFQAVVRDANNNLLNNQNVGIQISILQGSSSGNALFVESHTPSSNENGLVTIEIGAGIVSEGDFSTIDWSNGPYFIKTETDPTGGTSYSITGDKSITKCSVCITCQDG
jgi:hypothetical protein